MNYINRTATPRILLQIPDFDGEQDSGHFEDEYVVMRYKNVSFKQPVDVIPRWETDAAARTLDSNTIFCRMMVDILINWAEDGVFTYEVEVILVLDDKLFVLLDNDNQKCSKSAVI